MPAVSGLLSVNERWDFVIVGSGFGGSVSALRLVEKGYRVLMLEQGRRLGAADFPRSNWNLRRWLWAPRSEEHTSELQSRLHLVCRLLLEKKKKETSQ